MRSVPEAQASFEKEDGGLASDVVMPPSGVGPGRYKGDYSLGVAQLEFGSGLGRPEPEFSAVGRVDEDRSRPRQGKPIISGCEVGAGLNTGKPAVFGGRTGVEVEVVEDRVKPVEYPV